MNVCRRQAGQYKVNVTVWNPLSQASRILVVVAVNTLYGITLIGSPIVGAVRSPRSFVIGMTDFGPSSCITVDYGDDSGTEVYGPDRFIGFLFCFRVLGPFHIRN